MEPGFRADNEAYLNPCPPPGHNVTAVTLAGLALIHNWLQPKLWLENYCMCCFVSTAAAEIGVVEAGG